MPIIYCGKNLVLQPGKRFGTRNECFLRGLLLNSRRTKPSTGLLSIPGVGTKFAQRLTTEYNIIDQKEFIERVRRIRGKKRRKEFLKKVFRGFVNTRKTVRRSFDLARNYLEENGVAVQPMSR